LEPGPFLLTAKSQKEMYRAKPIQQVRNTRENTEKADQREKNRVPKTGRIRYKS
jgi:hypothetical protein